MINYSLQSRGDWNQTTIKPYIEPTPKHIDLETKKNGQEKWDFEKEIRREMRKDAKEEKEKNEKVGELTKAQKTTPTEGTSGGVTKESKELSPYEDCDKYYISFLETYKGT